MIDRSLALRAGPAGGVVMTLRSIVVAFAYAWCFGKLFDEAMWLRGAAVGVGHRLLGGMMRPPMDRRSLRVRRGAMPALKFAAPGYGSVVGGVFEGVGS